MQTKKAGGEMNAQNIKVKGRKPFTKEQWLLLAIAGCFMIYIIAFNYVPIAGWVLSFFKYKPSYGLDFSNQAFVGLDNFAKLWREKDELIRVLKNTIILSTMSLLCSPFPMLLAIMFSEIKNRMFLRVAQTVTTFPNFISWIIIYGVCFTVFSNNGVWAKISYFLTGKKQMMGFLSNPDTAYVFHTLLEQWKVLGWNSIIYCAAIAGIDASLYEAAQIDGANRIMQIWHITIPELMSTFLVLFLLSISNLLSSGFDHYFVFYNPMVADKLLVLDLWTYRLGISQGDYSFSIAAGIMRTMVSLVLLFSMNAISRKVRGNTIV